MGHSLRLTVLLISTCAFMPMHSWGQTVSGDLVGRVIDQTGAAVANSTVTATNTGTNIQTNTQTNASGEYRIGNLPPGQYDVSASAPNFTTGTLKNVGVVLNQVSTANLTLEVSGTSTTVNV